MPTKQKPAGRGSETPDLEKYKKIKQAMIEGSFKFSHIGILQAAEIAKDMEQNPKPFLRLLQNPLKFTLGDVKKLAQLIDIPAEDLFNVIKNTAPPRPSKPK